MKTSSVDSTGFNFRSVLCAVAVALMACTAVSAQESFLYQGGGGTQVWENASNWMPEMGGFSTWPGEAPEAGTLDSADLSAPLGGNLEIAIATPGLEVDTLLVGATDGFHTTTITGTGDGTLTAHTIRSSGQAAAITNIDVDFVMPDGDLSLDPGQPPVRFTGRFINNAPQNNTVRTIHNDTGGTLYFTGQIVLSNDSNNAGHLSIISDPVSTLTISGVISDGDAPGGRITYARGDNTITSANTYSGSTIIPTPPRTLSSPTTTPSAPAASSSAVGRHSRRFAPPSAAGRKHWRTTSNSLVTSSLPAPKTSPSTAPSTSRTAGS